MTLLALDKIRTDGGTQVREELDEPWIAELMTLYEGGHEIEPILVVKDTDGTHWLAAGFHRLQAMRQLGLGSCEATVREGPTVTVEFARILACASNKHGKALTLGDKRRAIEMYVSTSEGTKATQAEIAQHCGVSHAFVSEVLRKSSDQNFPHASTHEAKRAAVQAAIAANPAASNREIARVANVSDKTVASMKAVGDSTLDLANRDLSELAAPPKSPASTPPTKPALESSSHTTAAPEPTEAAAVAERASPPARTPEASLDSITKSFVDLNCLARLKVARALLEGLIPALFGELAHADALEDARILHQETRRVQRGAAEIARQLRLADLPAVPASGFPNDHEGVKCGSCKHAQSNHRSGEMRDGKFVRKCGVGKCEVRGCKCKAFEVPKTWTPAGPASSEATERRTAGADV
jgi:hypothetical protein